MQAIPKKYYRSDRYGSLSRNGSYNPYTILKCGIHVFTDIKEAKHALEQDSHATKSVCLVQVTVSGFLGAGEHYRSSDTTDGMKGECWNYAKITHVLGTKAFGEVTMYNRAKKLLS